MYESGGGYNSVSPNQQVEGPDGDAHQHDFPNSTDLSVPPAPLQYQPIDSNFARPRGFSKDTVNPPLPMESISGHQQPDSTSWNGQGAQSTDNFAITPASNFPFSSHSFYPWQSPVVQSATHPELSSSAPIAAGYASLVGAPYWDEYGSSQSSFTRVPPQISAQNQHLMNHAPEMNSKGTKWIEHKPENHAAKKSGLMKGPCIQCMIANVECRGRGENRNRCDRCVRNNINFYCRGPVPRLTMIENVSEWIRVADGIRADPTEGLADINERIPKEVDLTYEWRSNWVDGSHREHGLYQRRLTWSEGRWSVVDPMSRVQFFHLRQNITDLKRACMGFILILKVLRSPSVVTVKPQQSDVNKPPQALAIIEEFVIHAESLLQEINKYVRNFLKEKPPKLFAREAFNLGLVWQEVTQFSAIPDDWRLLGKLERLMNPLVDRTPTLLENIESIGRAINAIEFKKGQIHRLEDFEDIHFIITVNEAVDVAAASLGNGTSVEDTLLRRQPYHYQTHIKRKIRHLKQELERYNKADADLRAFGFIQIDGYEGAMAETGLLTPMSTTGMVSNQSVSTTNEEDLRIDGTLTATLMDASSNNAASSGLRQPKSNQETADTSVTTHRKRKPTQSDDLAIQARRVKPLAFELGNSDTPPINLATEDTDRDELGAKQTAVSLNDENANINSASSIGDPSALGKIAYTESSNMIQDAMEGVQTLAQHREEVLSGPITLEHQILHPPKGDSNSESLDDFVNSIVRTEMFADNISLSLSPNTNLQHEQLHSENPAQAAPDKILEPKKKSLLSFQHLAEVFRSDSHGRPATYPRRPMRQSVQHGIQKMSHWLKGLHIGDEPGIERRTSSVAIGFRGIPRV